MLRRDKMTKESECVETIFMEYINNKSHQNIFLFFEGKDDFKYYCPRLLTFFRERNYKKYNCDSKQNVIKIHNLITENTSKNDNILKMFFVDKDFEDNSFLDEDIYVTPTYSIENLYFTDIAIKNFIEGEMGLSAHSKDDCNDFYIAFNYIKDFRDNLIKDIIYANVFYSLQIKKAQCLGINQPNLSMLKKYDDIKEISSIDDIKNKVVNSIEITEDEFEEEYSRLKENPVKLLRGKYLLEKMPKCINRIAEESNKKENSMFSKRRLVHLRTSESKLISDLSSYAETPNELYDYIEKFIRN